MSFKKINIKNKDYLIDFCKMGVEVACNKLIALSGISIGVKELKNNIVNHSFKGALMLAVKTLMVNLI